MELLKFRATDSALIAAVIKDTTEQVFVLANEVRREGYDQVPKIGPSKVQGVFGG